MTRKSANSAHSKKNTLISQFRRSQTPMKVATMISTEPGSSCSPSEDSGWPPFTGTVTGTPRQGAESYYVTHRSKKERAAAGGDGSGGDGTRGHAGGQLRAAGPRVGGGDVGCEGGPRSAPTAHWRRQGLLRRPAALEGGRGRARWSPDGRWRPPRPSGNGGRAHTLEPPSFGLGGVPGAAGGYGGSGGARRRWGSAVTVPAGVPGSGLTSPEAWPAQDGAWNFLGQGGGRGRKVGAWGSLFPATAAVAGRRGASTAWAGGLLGGWCTGRARIKKQQHGNGACLGFTPPSKRLEEQLHTMYEWGDQCISKTDSVN
ncbi:uncharacterized protein LOC109707802 [Ananas comosus]|uniref:Uncharacterized protein LOC109707802 n=1 Tax=Ananas comosus TaxID=4615 RepID=A0A6P5EUU1_ANACO|nr:uncharacterized protein LOC109707802 [Ananas comosus]